VRVRDERRALSSVGESARAGSIAPLGVRNGSSSSSSSVASEDQSGGGSRARDEKARAGAKKGPTRSKAKGPSKNRLGEQDKAERAVEEAEAAMRSLEDELADPAAWATRYEAAKSEARHTAATRAVEEAYSRLEALID